MVSINSSFFHFKANQLLIYASILSIYYVQTHVSEILTCMLFDVFLILISILLDSYFLYVIFSYSGISKFIKLIFILLNTICAFFKHLIQKSLLKKCFLLSRHVQYIRHHSYTLYSFCYRFENRKKATDLRVSYTEVSKINNFRKKNVIRFSVGLSVCLSFSL